jgi:hypothetical protein
MRVDFLGVASSPTRPRHKVPHHRPPFHSSPTSCLQHPRAQISSSLSERAARIGQSIWSLHDTRTELQLQHRSSAWTRINSPLKTPLPFEFMARRDSPSPMWTCPRSSAHRGGGKKKAELPLKRRAPLTHLLRWAALYFPSHFQSVARVYSSQWGRLGDRCGALSVFGCGISDMIGRIGGLTHRIGWGFSFSIKGLPWHAWVWWIWCCHFYFDEHYFFHGPTWLDAVEESWPNQLHQLLCLSSL